MTPVQMKAARALLGWSRTGLAAWSDTSFRVVTTFEQTGRVAPIRRNNWPKQIDTLAALRGALEEPGVEFTDGNAPGVRLQKPAGAE